MEISITNTYRIKNKNSELYVTVAGYTKDKSAILNQEPLQPTEDENRVSQIWLVFPINNGCHLAVNMRSFLLMKVAGDSTFKGALIEQNVMQADNPSSTQSWVINPDSGYFTIRNAVSKMYLHVAIFSKEVNAALQQWPVEVTSPERDSQLWTFEVEDNFPPIPPVEIKVFDDTEQSRKFSDEEVLEKKSGDVLVGQVTLPYCMIKDSGSSVYYVLRRYCYWKLVGHRVIVGDLGQSANIQIAVGLTSDNAEELLSITGIKVYRDASFRLSKIMNLVSDVFVNGLDVPVNPVELVPSILPRMEVTMSHAKLLKMTETVWYKENRFEMLRMDGTSVVTWTTRSSTFSFIQRHFQGPFDVMVPDVSVLLD